MNLSGLWGVNTGSSVLVGRNFYYPLSHPTGPDYFSFLFTYFEAEFYVIQAALEFSVARDNLDF